MSQNPVSKQIINIQKTKDDSVILYSPYNKKLIEEIKTIKGRKYIPALKAWSIPYYENYKKYLHQKFGGNYQLNFSEPHKKEITSQKDNKTNPSQKAQNDFLTKLQVKRYSQNTLRNYTAHFNTFCNYFKGSDPEKLTDENVYEYLNYIVIKKEVSPSYQKMAINSIKFYYENVLQRKVKSYLYPRPKEGKKLPIVLSEEEIRKIIESIENIKHKTIIMAIYSSGLRISEATNLKLNDIDVNRMIIRIEQTKGKKDRYTPLSKKFYEMLEKYLATYNPKLYVFEGQDGGKYSTKSIQKIFQKALKKKGIMKKATVHTLRHSYATHLLEHGTDLRYIQEILGHNSSKTTEIYTHVTTKNIGNIRSSLDGIL